MSTHPSQLKFPERSCLKFATVPNEEFCRPQVIPKRRRVVVGYVLTSKRLNLVAVALHHQILCLSLFVTTQVDVYIPLSGFCPWLTIANVVPFCHLVNDGFHKATLKNVYNTAVPLVIKNVFWITERFAQGPVRFRNMLECVLEMEQVLKMELVQ